MAGWLDDLLGYKEVLIDGVALTRRDTLNLVGATGADNPEYKRTDLTVGSSAVLWEWNGVDLSQFESAAGLATNSCVSTLSVVSDSGIAGGKKLRYQMSGSSLYAVASHLITQRFPQRYRIEWETLAHSAYCGFAIMADNATTFHGYIMASANGAQFPDRIDAGVRSSGSATPVGGMAGLVRGQYSLTVLGDKAAGMGPRFGAHYRGGSYNVGTQNGGGGMIHTGFPPTETAPVSWNGLACDRIGLAIKSAGSSVLTFDLASLRVLDLTKA